MFRVLGFRAGFKGGFFPKRTGCGVRVRGMQGSGSRSQALQVCGLGM